MELKKETENSLKTNKQKFLEEMKNKGCKKIIKNNL